MAGNINNLMAVHIPVAGAANFDYTVTRALQIVDIFATSNTGAAGGDTVNVQTNIGAGLVNAISAAMAVAAADIIRYGSITGGATFTAAQLTVPAAGVIRAIGNQATTNADCYCVVLPTSWITG